MRTQTLFSAFRGNQSEKQRDKKKYTHTHTHTHTHIYVYINSKIPSNQPKSVLRAKQNEGNRRRVQSFRWGGLCPCDTWRLELHSKGRSGNIARGYVCAPQPNGYRQTTVFETVFHFFFVSFITTYK